ncbi:uncharacterized protein LOC144883146 [Branchiostoma floridae x Branchiostoma japonicum]
MATGVRKCFFFVKENVSSDWKNLAYHLGFGRADIDNISSRNPDSKSCCMDLLEEWQQRKGDRATKEVLVEALTEANLQSVVDGLKMDYTDLQVGLHLGLRQQPATSVKEQYLERILELERTLFTVKVLNDPVRYRKVRKTFNAHKALLKKAVDGSIILLLTFLCQSDVDGFYHNHFRVGEGSLSQQLSDILITDELQKKVKGVQLIVRLHVKHEDYVRVRTRLGQGLHRTTSVDNLRTLPTRSCHLYHSSLRALDLAVVNGEDQACTVGVDGISSLKFTVKEVQAFARAGKGKSQQVRQLEDKLQVMRGQLHTARQETVAVTEEVARLKEKDEKAQKLVSEQKLEIQQLQETNKAAEQDTQALVKRLANEADRVKHEDEKAQKTLQELKLEIQQLKESNLSMKVTIDELQYSKHTAKGQDYGRKMVDPVKMEDPGKMEGPGTMEDTINPIKLQELETDVRKQLCQFSENEPFNVLVLGRPESGKSSFINSMHMAVAHRWYEVARYGDGSRMRAVSTDLVRYEMFRDELMEQPIEGYNHGVFFWDTAGLENCHTEITVTMLGLIMEGRIPPHTIIHEYTDVRKSRSLTVSSLERRFPHSGAMEEWKCHRVVFVCAADEEPSMNLMEAVTDAACKDEADARSLPIFLVMSKCDKVDRDGDAMYKSRRDNAALSLMVYRNNVRCKASGTVQLHIYMWSN